MRQFAVSLVVDGCITLRLRAVSASAVHRLVSQAKLICTLVDDNGVPIGETEEAMVQVTIEDQECVRQEDEISLRQRDAGGNKRAT